MPPRRSAAPLPPWTVVAADDPRERAGAMEPSAFVSAEWAREIKASSNRAWINAAKVAAAIAAERPDARYVEGWAVKGGVSRPVWHAWVDLPLGASERSWMRIDATPMWRWMMEHNRYGPVLEVRAAHMLPFAESLLRPRGKATCRLPLVPLAPERPLSMKEPTPAEPFAPEFGTEAAARAADVRELLAAMQRDLTSMVHVDGRSELDRLAAMGVLPRPKRSWGQSR